MGRLKALVLLGKTADDIQKCAEGLQLGPIVRVQSLEEAVELCKEKAQPGEAVLLSPACASWDMFDSYEQRGRLFKEYVRR